MCGSVFKRDVELGGRLRIWGLIGVVEKRGIRAGCGEGRAKTAGPATPSKRRKCERRISWS